MAGRLQGIARRGFDWLGRCLQRGFGSELNPLNQLGALTIFFFWIVLISGIWLLVFFRTSVDGAYESIEYLTHDQRYAGGVMRSLHRYASDAAVVTLVLHMVKEWVFDRHRGVRWFSWITGIPLLWIVIPLGVTGYWLVWDELAQYVALTSAELIDWLPIFTASMARNFLSDAAVSDRFFTLMAFLHLIGLPLFLVLGIWLHVFRISGPRINPPRKLMTGILLSMLALAVVYPALSQAKADLARAPQSLSLDWYYLLVFPLVKSWSPGAVWALLTGFSLLIFVAPWLPPAKRPQPALVDLENCNGCQRCADDCPYGAVMMQARTDGTSFEQEAVVDPSLCVSCGMCVGACPTATPFRKATALSPGIDLPDLSAAMLRSQVERAAADLNGDQRLMVFSCLGNTGLESIRNNATAVIGLRCMAHLPPSFIDFILSRNLADGVFLAGCEGGDCRYRLGAEWTRLRIRRERDPQLRKRIDERRIALGWDYNWGPGGHSAAAVERFRQSISRLGATGDYGDGTVTPARGWSRFPFQALFYGFFAVAASAFAAWPAVNLMQPGQGMVSLTFSHAGRRIGECRLLSQAELDKLPPNMRKTSDCPRERWPVRVELRIDGKVLYNEVLPPSGIWNDGESNAYARFPISSGPHHVFIGMNDSGGGPEFDFRMDSRISVLPEQHIVVEFDSDHGTFTIH